LAMKDFGLSNVLFLRQFSYLMELFRIVYQSCCSRHNRLRWYL